MYKHYWLYISKCCPRATSSDGIGFRRRHADTLVAQPSAQDVLRTPDVSGINDGRRPTIRLDEPLADLREVRGPVAVPLGQEDERVRLRQSVVVVLDDPHTRAAMRYCARKVPPGLRIVAHDRRARSKQGVRKLHRRRLT